MNNQQERGQVALPADEELKKHGDQLQQQVDDAAGRPAPERKDGNAGARSRQDPAGT
ncbi:MAG TPA: hypothetical protein VIM12_11745 [Noviherbaspirillum sp.]|jgi:hypothetical protein|uniref:hypothetical protein n=1 Tax=Noviherbaspirillum sp. TaxID=1926288 RepID=UPI002F940863